MIALVNWLIYAFFSYTFSGLYYGILVNLPYWFNGILNLIGLITITWLLFRKYYLPNESYTISVNQDNEKTTLTESVTSTSSTTTTTTTSKSISTLLTESDELPNELDSISSATNHVYNHFFFVSCTFQQVTLVLLICYVYNGLPITETIWYTYLTTPSYYFIVLLALNGMYAALIAHIIRWNRCQQQNEQVNKRRRYWDVIDLYTNVLFTINDVWVNGLRKSIYQFIKQQETDNTWLWMKYISIVTISNRNVSDLDKHHQYPLPQWMEQVIKSCYINRYVYMAVLGTIFCFILGLVIGSVGGIGTSNINVTINTSFVNGIYNEDDEESIEHVILVDDSTTTSNKNNDKQTKPDKKAVGSNTNHGSKAKKQQKKSPIIVPVPFVNNAWNTSLIVYNCSDLVMNQSIFLSNRQNKSFPVIKYCQMNGKMVWKSVKHYTNTKKKDNMLHYEPFLDETSQYTALLESSNEWINGIDGHNGLQLTYFVSDSKETYIASLGSNKFYHTKMDTRDDTGNSIVLHDYTRWIQTPILINQVSLRKKLESIRRSEHISCICPILIHVHGNLTFYYERNLNKWIIMLEPFIYQNITTNIPPSSSTSSSSSSSPSHHKPIQEELIGTTIEYPESSLLYTNYKKLLDGNRIESSYQHYASFHVSFVEIPLLHSQENDNQDEEEEEEGGEEESYLEGSFGFQLLDDTPSFVNRNNGYHFNQSEIQLFKSNMIRHEETLGIQSSMLDKRLFIFSIQDSGRDTPRSTLRLHGEDAICFVYCNELNKLTP